MLQLFDYGTDYNTFIKISNRFENYKFFNPALPKKYFGNLPIRPSVIPDGFKTEKSENTFRIFALGGSTTAGFPHPPNGSFPRLLKKFLSLNFPQINFEVINLGVSAINSITIRDIIDDVLKEKPDLIIIYAGHNEYYGALGPASNISGFNELLITRAILYLKNFKTVQLVENLIGNIYSLLSDNYSDNRTLMSEIAGQNLVPLNSSEYDKGVTQFESNLDYILNRCSDEKIQVLIGTLTSNLMQPPLCKYSGCDSLSGKFDSVVKSKSLNKKERLYEIKDRDELRFRAPERFNKIIIDYANKYDFVLFDVQKKFEDNSPEKIIGNNLMLDHLHPTFRGNKIIAELLFSIIIDQGFLDSDKLDNTKFNKSHFNFPNYFAYSSLDSIYALLKIKHLMNMFPFTPNSETTITPFFELKSLTDSLAWEIISGKISWESAHLNLANFYLNKKNYGKYVDEINILIEDKPFDKSPYLQAIRSLEKEKQIEELEYILQKYYKVYPDLFASRKLADIYFRDKNHKEAIYYYTKCLDYVSNDPKIYFNLSASYFGIQNLPLALENISKCLKLDPDFPNAQKIYNRLLEIYQKNK